MTIITKWGWELTPEAWLECIRPIKGKPTAEVGLETQPFKCPKKPLTGTPYTYQLALSATSTSDNITSRREAVPNVPISGDSRSGIIVFKDNTIIGSYIIPGNNTPHQVVVHESYRGLGIATRMLEQQFREVPAPQLNPQPINIAAIKTFLKALHNNVDWAVANGKSVPQEVRDAWASGVQEQAILTRMGL